MGNKFVRILVDAQQSQKEYIILLIQSPVLY